MESTDIAIIGAGVVGLALSRALSAGDREVLVLEKHPAFGQETSSRNSEVIHAGIYYPENSLKARTCVEGKRLLYEFCEENNIPYKRLGKLIVANDAAESEMLDDLLRRGHTNGVDDLRIVDADEIKGLEPNIRAIRAIHSPSTGIVDSHSLMKHLESSAKEGGTIFAYGCEVLGIDRTAHGYVLTVKDSDGDTLKIATSILINSAGLSADRIARMAGIDIDKRGYKLRYSKGEYFRVSGHKAGIVKRLVYPPPETASLGIHTVPDLQGQLKLGPNAFYVDGLDYDVDGAHVLEFHESAGRYLPWLERSDLSPDQAGIRPKLQRPGEPVADFIIADEGGSGFPGLVNLVGIESPGLTASLSIANRVAGML